MAHLLSFNYRDIGAVYAFGSPKVGDPVWSKSYPEWLAQKTFRVMHHTDYYANLPSAAAQSWSHVGQVLAPEGPSGNVTEPHSVESYFKSLVPAHTAAIGEGVDRISIKSQNILQGINYRETVRLKNFNVNDYDDSMFSEDLDTARSLDQNSRYELPQSTNLVRGPPVLVTRQQSAPQLSKKLNSGQHRVGQISKPLVAPDLVQQIRNNVFVLVANMKKLYAILFNGGTGDFNGILGTVSAPMKNLMIITGVISSHNDFVKELVRSINHFLQSADKFFIMAGDQSSPLEQVEKSWGVILPAAKVVGANCERVLGRV